MKTRPLKEQILAAYTAIIVLLAVCIFGLGFYVIKRNIYERTQQGVIRSLDSARVFYEEEINRIGQLLSIANLDESNEVLKDKLNLHYLQRLTPDQAALAQSEIVQEAVKTGRPIGGTRIISSDELARLNSGLQERISISILDTPKARPSRLDTLQSAMSKEYVLPVKNEQGQVTQVICGGRIVNKDNALVDRIRQLVFGDEVYKEKPLGTVTVFQDGVRISTNVLDEHNRRAIGTRVSAEVYDAVIQQGRRWLDRAFVVTHWYRTAYEPIRNIDGQTIGMLYVGVLEDPYNVMAAQVLTAFIIVIVLASILAFVLAFILSGSISRPLTAMMDATQRLSQGQLGHVIWPPHSNIEELHQLAHAFNDMSVRLEERDVRLQENHQKMAELNKTYLDLLGFVAHELKGLLASAVINAYSLRDGLLGMINFKQKKAVDSICRNLDYLDATVKKFLNLSRIERGNLDVSKTEFSLGKDVFESSIQTFSRQFSTKKMQVENRIDPAIRVKADLDLMQIVANNLVNNAVKYGSEGGGVLITASQDEGFVTVDVYNDSRPISPEMVDHLFKKFSRLDVPEKKKVKGTGLGLYITRQIIEAHGGTIRVEPRNNGNSFIFTIHKE